MWCYEIYEQVTIAMNWIKYSDSENTNLEVNLLINNSSFPRHSVVFRNIEEILAEKGEEVKKQIEEGALEIDSKINICKDIKK